MMTEIINWKELDKITNCKRELAHEMLEMLAAELPERQQQIHEALTAKNWHKLNEHIHKLHGSCAYCGATQLREAACELETRLKQNNTENINDYVAKIDIYIEAFLEVWNSHEQC